MSMRRQPETPLSTGDKIGAAFGSAFGLIACGPCIFLLLTFVVMLLLSLPFFLFTDEPPEWLVWPSAIIGGFLTVVLIIGMMVDRTRKEKEKEIIKAAELQRAKRELESD